MAKKFSHNHCTPRINYNNYNKTIVAISTNTCRDGKRMGCGLRVKGERREIEANIKLSLVSLVYLIVDNKILLSAKLPSSIRAMII